jgi:hypothetical protein
VRPALALLTLAGCGVDYVGLWDVTRWSMAPAGGGPGDERTDAGFIEFRGGPYVRTGADVLLRYTFDPVEAGFVPLAEPQLLPFHYTPDAEVQRWTIDGYRGEFLVEPDGSGVLRATCDDARRDGEDGSWRVGLDLER